MSEKTPFGFDMMNAVYHDEDGYKIKVTRQQMTILRAIRDNWFDFLKTCSNKKLKTEDDKIQAAKFVMQMGLGALSSMTKEQITALPPKWMECPELSQDSDCKHQSYIVDISRGRKVYTCNDCGYSWDLHAKALTISL
jgi:hypothetical protein